MTATTTHLKSADYVVAWDAEMAISRKRQRSSWDQIEITTFADLAKHLYDQPGLRR